MHIDSESTPRIDCRGLVRARKMLALSKIGIFHFSYKVHIIKILLVCHELFGKSGGNITCNGMGSLYHVVMRKFINKIVAGNCIELLGKVKEPFADLIFADPPFNIGYQYDKYKDKLKKNKYISWTEEWMGACFNVLKPAGSFYIAIGDDYAAHVRIIGDGLGLVLRNWIIWHYLFGQQTKNKFARAHTHIFYFVKDKNNFTFDDKAASVFSDRQRIYKDKRANPMGKMPDDVWNVYPRVCGTFAEREEWHPCQMPESLLARIIRVTTNDKEWVLDPFSGSGTTCVVADKLGRRYTGIDISPNYVEESQKRIKDSRNFPIEGEAPATWNSHFDSELKWLYHENKISTENLFDSIELLRLFTAKFNHRIGKMMNPYTPDDIKNRLRHLRKSAKLGRMEVER